MTRPVEAVTCRVPPEISYPADDKRFFKNLAMKFRLIKAGIKTVMTQCQDFMSLCEIRYVNIVPLRMRSCSSRLARSINCATTLIWTISQASSSRPGSSIPRFSKERGRTRPLVHRSARVSPPIRSPAVAGIDRLPTRPPLETVYGRPLEEGIFDEGQRVHRVRPKQSCNSHPLFVSRFC